MRHFLEQCKPMTAGHPVHITATHADILVSTQHLRQMRLDGPVKPFDHHANKIIHALLGVMSELGTIGPGLCHSSSIRLTANTTAVGVGFPVAFRALGWIALRDVDFQAHAACCRSRWLEPELVGHRCITATLNSRHSIFWQIKDQIKITTLHMRVPGLSLQLADQNGSRRHAAVFLHLSAFLAQRQSGK